MEVDLSRLREIRMDGKCCSESVLQAGLELDRIESEVAVRAAGGLCGGMRSGLVCGALSGACCAVAALAPEDKDEILPQLTGWFKERFGGEYGGIDCAVIICGDPEKKMERCPKIIEETYVKAVELLAQYGHEYD